MEYELSFVAKILIGGTWNNESFGISEEELLEAAELRTKNAEEQVRRVKYTTLANIRKQVNETGIVCIGTSGGCLTEDEIPPGATAREIKDILLWNVEMIKLSVEKRNAQLLSNAEAMRAKEAEKKESEEKNE